MPTANAYIDGFNMYYGCLKGTPYKWLNLAKLCQFVFPKQFTLGTVKYFTARITARSDDPDGPTRQNIYLRALATVPSIQIVQGHFLRHDVWMPLTVPPAHGSRFVQGIKTEEKGSDVNLAHLLIDAFTRTCDAALIISNDSDLLTPIQIARQRFLLKTILVSPHPTPSTELSQQADFRRQIRKGTLLASQFANTLTDRNGSFHKPSGW
ncbi:MAG TPA: NYN domain-containing protein [Candidatus Methylomirabilis sp.]